MRFDVTTLSIQDGNAEVETFDGAQFELTSCGGLRIFEHVGPGARVETMRLYARDTWLRVVRLP